MAKVDLHDKRWPAMERGAYMAKDKSIRQEASLLVRRCLYGKKCKYDIYKACEDARMM